MKLPNVLRKNARRERPKASHRAPRGQSAGPKNGPLVLAVVGTIVAIAVLGAVNVRLISTSSIAGKAFGTPASSKLEPACPAWPVCPSTSSENKACYVPPVVTFYSQLTAQEEQKAPGGDSARPKATGADPRTVAQGTGLQAAGREKEHHASVQGSPVDTTPGAAVPGRGRAPGPEHPSKTYTVQVGAFTNPGIAQQWAQKWKARGYDVALRPVARPKTGVIYRLYLGNFTTEKQADDLVNRLKSKEGVSAFRLVVQN